MGIYQSLKARPVVVIAIAVILGVWAFLKAPTALEHWYYRLYLDRYQAYQSKEARAIDPFKTTETGNQELFNATPRNASPERLLTAGKAVERHFLYQDYMKAAGETALVKRQYAEFADHNPKILAAQALGYRAAQNSWSPDVSQNAKSNLQDSLYPCVKDPENYPLPVIALTIEFLMQNGRTNEAVPLCSYIPEGTWLRPYFMARIARQLGKREDALAKYQEALRLKDAPFLIALAYAELLSEKPGEKLSFNPFVSLPEDKIRREPLASAYRILFAGKGVNDASSEISKEALYNPDALAILAKAAMRHKEYRLANGYVQRALRFEPNHPAALVVRGLLGLQENNSRKATALFSWGLKKNQPDLSPEFHSKMGHLLMQADQPEYALAHFQKAGIQRIFDLDVLKTLGKQRWEAKQYKEAMEIYERAYGMAPNDLTVLRGLCEAYKEVGENNKAIPVLEQILASEFDDYAARDLLADIYMEKKEINNALALYDLYLTRNPDSGRSYVRIAQIHHQLGNKKMSADFLQSTLQKRPNLKDRELVEKTLREFIYTTKE